MSTVKAFIKYWLKPSHWSALADGDVEVSENRRNIFFSQLCVLGAFFTVLQSIDDFIDGNRYLMIADVVTFLMWPLCYRLNEKGSHLFAKCILIGYLNILFFLLSSALDPSVRMELLFYPLIILTFMTLGSKDKFAGLFFAVLSFAFLITLSLTNNHPFGVFYIQEPNKIHELLNILTAAFFTGACAVFIIELHTMAEKSLREKKDDLAKVNEELDRFVYSASHDMRAPLLSIQGLVNIALMETYDPKQHEHYLQMIRNRAIKLDELIQDITNYSKNSRVGLDIQTVDLTELMNEAEEKVKFLDGVQSISITKKIVGNPTIKSDAGRLNILINNLLTNAVKHHDEKKEKRFVDLTIENGSEELKIIVRDNGIGIEKSHQDKIFQMFYRATSSSQGSGLGLYIVKEIVSRLNGEIFVQSELGRGSEFQVVIPHPV
jgi:signal transduction histidine kinase